MPHDGKSIEVQMRIWWATDQSGHPIIKMAWPGEDHITWVTNREGSARCHRNLYRKLKDTLESQGKAVLGIVLV
jgi:hypothetical protein